MKKQKIKKSTSFRFLFLFLCVSLSFFPGCGRKDTILKEAESPDPPSAPFSEENTFHDFNILTCLRKFDDRWFLVDCYHNQILYSDTLEAPPEEWKVMTREIAHGHTIDTDGQVYLADDTENNRVLVFVEQENGFVLSGIFNDIGILPHYVVYDAPSERFYVLSSMTGELYVFRHIRADDDKTEEENASGRVVLEKILSVPELNGCYVRSFTIEGEEVYFVSGNQMIIEARLSDLKIIRRYPVSREISGMVQLEKIEDFYYITISTDADFNQEYATMIRVKELSDLSENRYEDIYGYFAGGGTPYFIGHADGHYYLTEHRLPEHKLWQFDVENNEITHVISLH